MNELNQNQNTPHQTQALTRFRALNFIEDLQRGGGVLADALRQASLHPWPDENGDYYAVRTLEDWWYASVVIGKVGAWALSWVDGAILVGDE